jgi:RimJ/RimL family protein N-acetyltransferase
MPPSPSLAISPTWIEGCHKNIQCWRVEIIEPCSGSDQEGTEVSDRLRSAERELVGLLQLNTATGEVGFGTLEHYRGRGYAVAALQLLISHLKENAPFECLCGFTTRDNSPAQRVLERAGFRCLGPARLPANFGRSGTLRFELQLARKSSLRETDPVSVGAILEPIGTRNDWYSEMLEGRRV